MSEQELECIVRGQTLLRSKKKKNVESCDRPHREGRCRTGELNVVSVYWINH